MRPFSSPPRSHRYVGRASGTVKFVQVPVLPCGNDSQCRLSPNARSAQSVHIRLTSFARSAWELTALRFNQAAGHIHYFSTQRFGEPYGQFQIGFVIAQQSRYEAHDRGLGLVYGHIMGHLCQQVPPVALVALRATVPTLFQLSQSWDNLFEDHKRKDLRRNEESFRQWIHDVAASGGRALRQWTKQTMEPFQPTDAMQSPIQRADIIIHNLETKI